MNFLNSPRRNRWWEHLCGAVRENLRGERQSPGRGAGRQACHVGGPAYRSISGPARSSQPPSAGKTAGVASRAARSTGLAAAGLAALFVLIALSILLGQGAQTLAPLARAYRQSPTAARRNAVLRFASAHPRDTSGALALLVAGATELDQREHAQAVRHLTEAAARLPQLGDYAAFYLARAHFEQKEFDATLKDLESVLAGSPVSPLTGEAALLAGKARLEAGAPEKAVAVLKQHYARLPQPQGDMALATAYEATGQLALAATSGQRVYYTYPASKESADALKLLARVREALGPEYPPPLPEIMLGRAEKWMEARDYRRAQSEYESLILPSSGPLSGPQRELAQVRAGAALYLAGNTQQAETYFRILTLDSPEADAERLYYLVRCERAQENPTAMLDFVEQLNQLHPVSPWRLAALTWAGNYYVLRNDPASYVPLFRTCYEAFPKDPSAAYCHWKVAFNAYLGRQPDAGQLLNDHVRLFPQSDKCPAALYFLGRLAQVSSHLADARASYRRIIETYPNNYYAALALERLKPEVITAATSTPLPFEPAAVNKRHIDRSRLLSSAGLSDWAERELRFAAKEAGQPQIVATELARQAASRGAPEEAIRYIKSVFPDYLRTPFDAAPLEMWRLAFPLAFRPQLEKLGQAQGLDPYFLAGLIRQESEFDPRALSRAGARGLMQIMPPTGRELSRGLKLGRFSSSRLDNPDYNIRLGTFYFRSLLDAHSGSKEAALASYNGGKTKVEA